MYYEVTGINLALDKPMPLRVLVVAEDVAEANAKGQDYIDEIAHVNRSLIREITNCQGSRLWKATLRGEMPADGKTKVGNYIVLTRGDNFAHAADQLRDYISQGYEMEIVSMSVIKIDYVEE